MTNDDASWGHCIEALYDAVGKEAAVAAALGRFRGFFGARGVVYLSPPTRASDTSLHLAACDIDHSSLAEYHSHYFAHDEWVKVAWRQGGLFEPGFAALGSELVPRAELVRSYFWRDFLVRYGITDVLCGTVEGATTADTQPTIVSFHRSNAQHGDFPAEAKDRLKELLPHLRRSLRMHRRLAPELSIGATLKELFETLDMPMVYLDRDGCVLEANGSAQRALAHKGHLQSEATGALKVRLATGWANLAKTLRTLETESAVTLPLVSAQGIPAWFSLRRAHGVLTDRFSTHRAFAVASLRAPQAIDTRAMLGRFGLSAAQTRVAQLLLAGKSPKEMAAELKVSVATIRTHLSHMYEKTGTHRQSQLIARIQGGS
jgi:DNA-binding CsgD family transcriptional regulator/PAS domain-containing protein